MDRSAPLSSAARPRPTSPHASVRPRRRLRTTFSFPGLPRTGRSATAARRRKLVTQRGSPTPDPQASTVERSTPSTSSAACSAASGRRVARFTRGAERTAPRRLNSPTRRSAASQERLPHRPDRNEQDPHARPRPRGLPRASTAPRAARPSGQASGRRRRRLRSRQREKRRRPALLLSLGRARNYETGAATYTCTSYGANESRK
jgi:hypothetical protein